MTFIQKICRTDASDSAATIARLTAGLVMFPHGMQKLVGWFGGGGFTKTVEMMSGMGLPKLVVMLVIIAESFGSISLILGIGTRWSAFWLGIIMAVAALMSKSNGFFMNWAGSQAGEGFEFHILFIGLCLVLLKLGGGAWSIDSKIAWK